MAEQEQKQEKVVQMPEFAKPKPTGVDAVIQARMAEMKQEDIRLDAEGRDLAQAIQAANARMQQVAMRRVALKTAYDELAGVLGILPVSKEQAGAKE